MWTEETQRFAKTGSGRIYMSKLEASSFLFSGCTPIETAAYLSLKGPLKIFGAENTAGFIPLIRHCILNPECLPRQARDKHRKLGGTVALAPKI
jgi:hypothetical protein